MGEQGLPRLSVRGWLWIIAGLVENPVLALLWLLDGWSFSHRYCESRFLAIMTFKTSLAPSPMRVRRASRQ